MAIFQKSKQKNEKSRHFDVSARCSSCMHHICILPLCIVLMELAVQLEARSCELDLSWTPRDQNVEADELHVLYIGVLQYFVGSLLWLLTYKILAGSPDDNLDRVWRVILDNYGGSSNQYNAMSINLFW